MINTTAEIIRLHQSAVSLTLTSHPREQLSNHIMPTITCSWLAFFSISKTQMQEQRCLSALMLSKLRATSTVKRYLIDYQHYNLLYAKNKRCQSQIVHQPSSLLAWCGSSHPFRHFSNVWNQAMQPVPRVSFVSVIFISRNLVQINTIRLLLHWKEKALSELATTQSSM